LVNVVRDVGLRLGGGGEAVGLPSGDKVEADESEDAEYRGRRERVDQHDRRCGESDDPERHADVTAILTKAGSSRMATPKA
jgi:hypothetical protein